MFSIFSCGSFCTACRSDKGDPCFFPHDIFLTEIKYPSPRQLHKSLFLSFFKDLNYRSPSVLSEMTDVLRYWLDLGVDGFRMDAVLGIFEDGRFLDEPLSGLTDDPVQKMLQFFTFSHSIFDSEML